MPTVPTQGETYSQLMEHLRKAQEASAMLAHLAAANDDRSLSNGWLVVSENFRKMQHSITQLATKGMH